MNWRPWLGLAVWLAVVYAAAAVGAIASVSAAEFYAQLQRPGWAPPGWVFGPVWTTLYTLMGVAAWLVWRERGFRASSGPLTLFLVQLVVNALWSWFFFAWRQGAVAFIEAVLLWLLIAATIAAFWRAGQRLAAGLLLPYIAWVSLAVALTHAVWRANPGLL